MRLSDFSALTFDVYGTLIDWETGIVEGLRGLVQRVGTDLARDEILQAHARHEVAQQRLTPAKRYRDLLAVVHRRLAEEWGVPVSPDESSAYGRSIGDWPPFPDSAEALAYLKQHFRLFVLSNVDRESFALSSAKLGVAFEGIFTAEDIGSYKPSPDNFRCMLDRLAGLGIRREEVLHVAESIFHDHVPASREGIACCHIHRRHGQEGFGATMPPGEVPPVAFRFTSLEGLASAHREEQAGAGRPG